MGRSARSRWLPSLAALAAQLFALLHVVVVRHETCPAHGEVVHHQGERSAATATDGEALRPAPASEITGDDHCLVVAASRADATPCILSSTVVPPPPAPGQPPGSCRCGSPSIRRFLLAPKTSPPLVG